MTKTSSISNKRIYYKKNPLETKINNLDSFFDQNASESSSFLERLFANKEKKKGQERQESQRKEFTIFTYRNYYEQEAIKKDIRNLTEEVKKEIEALKKANQSLLHQVKDIENVSVQSLPEKPGVYHATFLELVLSILKTLRIKVGEAKTWLTAMQSKKKKRGSLFAALSKKKGTQYSLSQELSSSRSVM